MRVLHVVQELRTGGAERVVVALTAGARRAGHDVAAAAAPGELARELDAETFELPLVRRRIGRLVPAAWALRAAMRRWGPDLLHCHNPGMALVAALATGRGRLGAPGLVTFHGVPDEDYPRATRTLRLAGFPVVACGPGVAAGLHEHGLEVAATVVNGIGPVPPAGDRSAVLRELGLAVDRPLLVAVGRLVAQKDHALALRALSHVPEASLLIVGEGPLRAPLERQIAESGLAGRAVLIGARANARSLVGAADALVLSSRWEGLPLVALEALAAGTPVVATAVRGVRELLADGRTALLVPPGDDRALGSALSRVLSDHVLSDTLAAAGHELAAAHSDEAMVEGYLRLYERFVTA